MRVQCNFAAVGVLVIALGGCAAGDVLLDRPPPGYVADVAARTAAVDWTTAEAVTVELSEFEFKPGSLAFREGVPYRLVLRNTGDSRHRFVSEGFFQAIWAHKLVSAEGENANPYVKTIEVPPGATKELQFVAVRTGAYPLECTVFLHAAFGMDGRIVVR